MEKSLRELIAQRPTEEFRGIYVESGLSATRKNILAPGAIGVYTGGGTYNPSQVLRNQEAISATTKIDRELVACVNKTHMELPIKSIKALLAATRPDDFASERVWNTVAIAESLGQLAKLRDQETGYVYVDRERGLKESRRETQGILDGGEAGRVPRDKVTLFLLRTRAERGMEAAWWPQIRFPDGRYAFAFAI